MNRARELGDPREAENESKEVTARTGEAGVEKVGGWTTIVQVGADMLAEI